MVANAFMLGLMAALCSFCTGQQPLPIQYRWAYRNPLSVTSAAATDLGEGSYNGTVNSLSNEPQQGTLPLRYAHGGTFGVLPNGSLAAIWQASPLYWEGSAKQAAYWSLSNDSGQTWGPAILIYSLPNGPLWGPVIHVQDGAIWMFFSGTAPTVCKYQFAAGFAWPPGGDLQVVKSLDNGQTWGAPTLIAPIAMDDGSAKLGIGRVVVNEEGEWLLPFWRERSGPACWGTALSNYTGVPGVFSSKDQGATWQLLINAIDQSPAGPKASWMIESSIAAFRAGNTSGLLQIFRTNTSRVWQSASLDNGATWSPAQPGTLPAPNSKSAIYNLSDGSLLVAFNNSTSLRADLSVARSVDGGVSWQHLATVDNGPGQYSYPTLQYLPQTGQVAVIYSVWHAPSLAPAAVAQTPPVITPAVPPPGLLQRSTEPAALAATSGKVVQTEGRRRSLCQLPESRKLLGAMTREAEEATRQSRRLLQVPYNQGAWGAISYGIRVASFDLKTALAAQPVAGI